MKKYFLIASLILFIISCSEDQRFIGNPADDYENFSEVTKIETKPLVGAAMVKWIVPQDSSFTYLEISYKKGEKKILKQISRYRDSLLVDELINKEPIVFKIKTIGRNGDESRIIETEKVTPIRRDSSLSYNPEKLEQVEVSAEMLDTYTQEVWEGPKENLLDGDKNTFWHSAYSSGVEPLPHWIQINFDDSQKEIGAFKYYHRQGVGDGAKPQKWAVEISEDGKQWKEVYKSSSISLDSDKEHLVTLDKNYRAKHFRFKIIETPSMGNFTYLGEISFFEMDSFIVDKEKEAEEKYYKNNY